MAIFSPKRKTSSGTEEVQFPISSINGLQAKLDTFVDKTSGQTITGSKTFTGTHYFTGETQFTNTSYAPTFTDIANGIGKSSGFTRGAFMQAFIGQVIAPNANHTDATRGYSIESGKIKFQRVTGTANGQPTLTDLAVLSANGLTVLGKQVATTDQIPTDTGATSVAVSGSGNAVTTASYDASTRKLTLTKGTTFLTSHQDISGKANLSGATFTGKITAPIIETGTDASNYFQSQKFRGQGDANTYYHAVDFGYSGHNQVDFHEYGGVYNFYKNTAGTSTGGTLICAITAEGVKATNFNSRFALQSVPYGTSIGSNANLNTTAYLKVGNYYCSTDATVKTLTNCPTSNAFMMTVYSPLATTVDNETTGQWVYRVRKLMTYTGEEYIQCVNSGSTAGTFTYGTWKKIAKTSDIPSITTASGANINSVGTPSVTATTSGGVTTLTFNYLKGATGATGATGAKGATGATGVGISSITITEA